ncbi:MAG: chloride channel protein [Oligoflexales bacterium]
MSSRGDFSVNGRLAYLMISAVVLGAAAAIAAVILIDLINFFTNLFFYGKISIDVVTPTDHHLGLWVIGVPAVGGLIIGLMARYGSDKIRGHGIPEALEAILFGKSLMSPKVALLKPLSSAISIGSGGPFGAEGPIIMTGGAIGSLFSQLFAFSSSERKVLLVAGAAAGMSAVFASPIAAILLAVELMLFEMKPRSLIPVAIASITAYAMRPYLLGSGPVFPVSAHATVDWVGILSSCAVGLIAGLFSAGTSNFLYKVEDLFLRLPFHWMWWCVIGGLVVGIGGYFQPRALGVGYDVIDSLLNSNFAVKAALTLLIVKAFIWVVSLGSGTSGGVLAPLLMMGCGLGVVEELFLPGQLKALYPLISMAAVMGGMMRAPFTATMFAFELTHNTDATVPTFVATIVAYTVTVIIMKRSILTEKIARRGFDIFREYSVDPTEMVPVQNMMTQKVITIPEHLPIKNVMEQYFQKAKHRGFPVVDKSGQVIGMVTMTDIIDAVSHGASEEERAGDLFRKPVECVLTGESCRSVTEKMAHLGVGRVPVLNREEPHQLVGIITRSDLLRARSEQYEVENRREHFIRPWKQKHLRDALGKKNLASSSR